MSTATEVLTRKPNNIAIATNPEHELKVVDAKVPEIKSNECLVHVRATGICGSDVHFWKHGNIGDSVVCGDLGLGHESAGVIVKTGEDVKGLSVGMFAIYVCYFKEKQLTSPSSGDRVALENGIPCSRPDCRSCRTGEYHGCPNMTFFSSPPVDGTLRRYHAHPAAWLHKIPESISYEEGALLEPLSVALAGVERSGLRLGDPLVICGAGPIGLVTLLTANAAGAAPIVITDIDEYRLGVAKKLIPRVRTVKVEKDHDSKQVAENVKTALGDEAKLVMECTGVESSIHSGIYVRPSCH